MATVANFLTVDDVTKSLETTPLAVRRLIARRVLPANRIGEGGPFRVAESDLQAYIGKNCPDLAAPPIDSNGWLLTPYWSLAEQFSNAVADAAADQVLPIEEARKLFADAGRTVDTIDVPIVITPVVQKVLDAPRPGAAFATPEQRAAEKGVLDASWKLTYFAVLLRDAAEVILRDKQNQSPVDRFYGSPEEYGSIVSQVVGDVLRRRIGFSRTYTLDAFEPAKRIFYLLDHGKIINEKGLNNVAALAF
ncbi:MAG TPA: helix-turn-helix domain-containing protein [Thermoguttaceae bacterium]|nr:helix-turn-helix domain-containing protein [Thermoguttaceae bacterium]